MRSVSGRRSFLLPAHQPCSWEVFLAGIALKTLCPGLDFHEKYFYDESGKTLGEIPHRGWLSLSPEVLKRCGDVLLMDMV